MKVLPPTYFVLLLLASGVLHLIFPIQTAFGTPINYVGTVPIVFGAVMNMWADSLFKKSKTTVKPDEKPSQLITRGPFKLSRHPMYAGMAAILLGVSVLLGTVSTFLSPALFIITMERNFIPIEESNLEKTFGSEYEEYRKRTRRWI